MQEKFFKPGIVEIKDIPGVKVEKAKTEGFYISTPRCKYEQKGKFTLCFDIHLC